ncbi:TPA: hypothetical protein LA460_000298 [Clostridium botulinum]|nr:hypothetical protein [Clostridium botulinum]HBJ1652902.1 hypothetical protein [Clostridium botulinum]
MRYNVLDIEKFDSRNNSVCYIDYNCTLNGRKVTKEKLNKISEEFKKYSKLDINYKEMKNEKLSCRNIEQEK